MMRRQASILLLLTGLLTPGFGTALAGGGDDLRREFSLNRSTPAKRFGWFYHKRAYPADTIAHGYLRKALDRLGTYGPERTVELAWDHVGPRPGTYFESGMIAGRIPALAIHPTNPSIVYAGSADGGVWKTTNGGTDWVPMTDDLATLATGSLAIDPRNPERVVWGTGEPYYAGDAYGGAGVFMSTNGGATWAPIGLDHEKRIPDVAVDPNNGSTLFAAAWGGVYRTTNTGVTWTRSLSHGYAYDIAVHPTNSSMLFAAVGDNSTEAGIYRSGDNGVTWTKLTSGLPPSASINRIRLEISRSTPSTMYALMSSRTQFGALLGLYRSTNSGSSWTRLSSAPSDLFGSNNQGWYDLALAVNPANASHIYIGGIRLYRSMNGGAGWSDISGSGVHADQHAIAFSDGVIYIGNDGGVWKSQNNGNSWTNLNRTLATTQFYSVGIDRMTPGRLYGGTQDNGTQRAAGSSTWAGVIPGDGGMVVVDPASSAVVYGESQNGTLYRSLDGGTSFTLLSRVSGVWVTPLRLDPVAPGTVYTAHHRVLRSTNRGSTWQPMSDSLNGSAKIHWLTVHPTLPGTMYAVSNERVFRTTNGGETWRSAGAGLPARYVEQVVIDATTPSTVYAVLSGTGSSHVFRSSNGGEGWMDASGDLPDIPCNTLLVHPGRSSTVYLGTDLGLFVSTNTGATWLKETGLPNVAIMDLALTGDNRVVAATHGRGMYAVAIQPDPALAVVTPNGGDTLLTGSVTTIRWNTGGVSGDVRISVSRDGGVTYADLPAGPFRNDGSEYWSVTGPDADDVRFRVSSVLSPGISDISDGPVTIGTPSLTLTSPGPYAIWPIGSVRPVQWITRHLTGAVRIELSRDGGTSFPDVLVSMTGNDGMEYVTVTGPGTTSARIRIMSHGLPAVGDTSPVRFAVAERPVFTVALRLEDGEGTADTLYWGTASGATNGLDPTFGEIELPPPPPPVVFDVRWEVEGTQGARYDLRDTLARATLGRLFAGRLQAGRATYPFILRWDRSTLPPGVFILRDRPTAGSLFRVDMRSQDSLAIGNPAIRGFEIVYSRPESLLVPLTGGWNMLSLPLTVENPYALAIFPEAQSLAYSFTQEGYTQSDTLRYGTGYWIKVPPGGALFHGVLRERDTISVVAGWNLVGSVSIPVDVTTIEEVPPGIIQSGYIGASGASAVIEPGRSYWVKAGRGGRLIMGKKE